MSFRGAKLWWAIAKLCLLFSMFGLFLQLFRPKLDWWVLVLVANLIGWALSFSLIGIWFNYRQIAKHRLRVLLSGALGVCVGLLGGAMVGALIKGKNIVQSIEQDAPNVIKVALILGVIYALLIGMVAGWRNKNYETINAQLELEAEREKNARQASESQLRLLRAQIEPHFLFNTLGAVQQLAEQGAPQAAQLTANLIVFLRASMSEMRSDQISLAEEFQLVRAYLEVMQVRMGSRLEFHLDLPRDLGDIKLPSMVLLTLAENAIKHGIEPSLRGGSIQISASKIEDTVVVLVQDSGIGLSDKPSTGIGLQNVRDRLRLLYGARAELAISEVETGGVLAELRMPIIPQGV